MRSKSQRTALRSGDTRALSRTLYSTLLSSALCPRARETRVSLPNNVLHFQRIRAATLPGRGSLSLSSRNAALLRVFCSGKICADPRGYVLLRVRRSLVTAECFSLWRRISGIRFALNALDTCIWRVYIGRCCWTFVSYRSIALHLLQRQIVQMAHRPMFH